jgi:hypothetical protein
MSFVGDLDHLPIVDVIQLLHTARKSGTLIVRSGNAEAQLVFGEGFIVSANHTNNSVRIGNILVKMGAITKEDLERALEEQRSSGPQRRPLIATLIEGEKINRDDAYKGLETLIEMTIVEVLTWSSGTFELDVDNLVISDEYRYFPENLKQDIHLNTQSVLMDALRIYDESVRDGNLAETTFADDEPVAEDVPPPEDDSLDISAELLGLSDIDTLERKIPPVFIGVKEQDPTEMHRVRLRGELRDVPRDEQDRLYSFLAAVSAPTAAHHPSQSGLPLAVIVFSRSELISHTLTTVCKHEGLLVFATDDELNLDMIIDQSINRKLLPVLVLDQQEPTATTIDLLKQKRSTYPELTVLQLAAPDQYLFALQALREGARAVLPRPDQTIRPDSFVDDLLIFLGAVCRYLHNSFDGENKQVLQEFTQSTTVLACLSEPPEIALLLLHFAAAVCERALTLVVGKEELISERGVGIGQPKGAGAAPSPRFTIPMDQPSLFRDVVESGKRHFGPSDDLLLQEKLFTAIGAPVSNTVLLMPVKRMGRVIAVIYGDFRLSAATPLQLELLDALVLQAGMVMDNTYYKSRLHKPAPAP